jgi:hypothetical protein
MVAQPSVPGYFAESTRIFAELSMPHERARTQHALARYELAQGNHQRGAALLREVCAVFARLGMEGELQRIEHIGTTNLPPWL